MLTDLVIIALMFGVGVGIGMVTRKLGYPEGYGWILTITIIAIYVAGRLVLSY